MERALFFCGTGRRYSWMVFKAPRFYPRGGAGCEVAGAVDAFPQIRRTAKLFGLKLERVELEG